MIVVHHLIIGRSLFTVWLLEELGLEYELEIYERLPTRRAPKSLKAIHPLGKSPVIVDDGRVIHESGAIASYLVERYDPENELAPSRDDLDAWVEFTQWLHYPEGSAFAPLLLTMLGQLSPDPVPASIESFAAGEVALQLGYIEDSLGDKPYILGADFSAADIGLGYVSGLAERLGLIDTHPGIVAYLEQLRARPAFRAALERTGEGQIA